MNRRSFIRGAVALVAAAIAGPPQLIDIEAPHLYRRRDVLGRTLELLREIGPRDFVRMVVMSPRDYADLKRSMGAEGQFVSSGFNHISVNGVRVVPSVEVDEPTLATLPARFGDV